QLREALAVWRRSWLRSRIRLDNMKTILKLWKNLPLNSGDFLSISFDRLDLPSNKEISSMTGSSGFGHSFKGLEFLNLPE
ncbi:MAG: hypothetical protein NUW07_10585, partial [Candidatus Saccharicenans sp.]|nr:hypothetical protein [Candidatus Saccharicenans sp.]